MPSKGASADQIVCNLGQKDTSAAGPDLKMKEEANATIPYI